VPTIRSRTPTPKLDGHARAQRGHTLTMTGGQHANRWLIFLGDHATTLTGESFHALIDLVRALGDWIELPRESIHRLRREVEPVLGREGAAAFIKTVGGAYCVAIKPKQYKKRVLATRCFFERAGRAVNENSLKTIKKLCHILGKKRAETLPDCNWNVTRK
jgi:hypothetical protein